MKTIYLKKIFLLLLLSSSFLVSDTTGKASWYGEKFHGKKTASGELFNMYDYTAAHPSYAFGTMLKVTNLSNKKSIKVRVTDRGPYSDDRIIDLSFQAAEEIGMIKSGVAKVRVEKIDISSSDPTEIYPIELDDEQVIVSKSATDNIEKELDEDKIIVASKNSKESSATELDEDQVFYTKNTEKQSEKTEFIKLQVASFSQKKNAEKFMKREKNNYEMKTEKTYVKHLKKTLYKVFIVCDSSAMVKDIRDSKKYKGAYILTKNID